MKKLSRSVIFEATSLVMSGTCIHEGAAFPASIQLYHYGCARPDGVCSHPVGIITQSAPPDCCTASICISCKVGEDCVVIQHAFVEK